jgi:outer membrane lipoprotein-sorting protein
MIQSGLCKIEGFIKIHDPKTGEVLVEKKNAIHYENISLAMAQTLSDRNTVYIYQMAFGNGGAAVDQTGVITYLPPNTTGQNAALYNQTYAKIVDDTSVFNLDPTRNKMTVFHTTGRTYTDILVQCLLDYGEPSGQDAFDNSTQTDSSYIFDELGLLANYGTDSTGNVITRLLTHVIFHPVQKSLNRQIQIDYTLRIQTLTNLSQA